MHLPRALQICRLFLFLAVIASAKADWVTDSGYPQLSAELGANLPNGAGITVLQSEANTGSTDKPAFQPQASATSPFAGAGNYSGKTFTVDSTIGLYSAHADSVASVFYGNSGSFAPGVTDVHIMLANDFINNLFNITPPATATGSVQNHSWIGTPDTTDVNNKILRAFDYMINRDGVVICVPLNNLPESNPPSIFMWNSYHAISAGLLNGQHSSGGTTADGSGRMKPDLVVDWPETSYASPSVACSVALLRQAIKASFTGADHPQAIKAIFLAAATKKQLPAWRRAGTSTPYDSTFGAGELNVLNAYHILAKGSQTPSASSEVAIAGWDYNTAQSSSTKRYFFTLPTGSMANTFSAALTWHRSVTLSAGVYSSTLPNLTLKLYASSNFTLGAVVDQSNSTLDNVQHLFQRNLPAGQYALEVSSNTDSINYGLAWEAQKGLGPIVTAVSGSGTVSLNLANLDPFVTYTVQQSSDLIGWSTATTILTSLSTASTTATWQDTSVGSATAKFYRLQWTAVR